MGNQIQNESGRLSLTSLIAVVLFGWFASGCGATQSGQDNVYSVTPGTLGSATGSNTICNQMTTASTRLNASLRTIDGNTNMIRVRITGMTSAFDGNALANLQFYRWKVSGGVTSLDQTPLTFHIETASQNGQGGSELTNNMTGINMANIKQIVSSNIMSTSTAEQFFSQVDIIVHNLTSDYQALKFVIYSGSSVFASNDALIPAFAANPVTYDAGHAVVLNSLHPFASQIGYSDAQYLSMAQAFCF